MTVMKNDVIPKNKAEPIFDIVESTSPVLVRSVSTDSSIWLPVDNDDDEDLATPLVVAAAVAAAIATSIPQ